MEIILVRHGESRTNALKGDEREFTGQKDEELSPLGIMQAKALRGNPIFDDAEAFYVSDLTRALRTAQEITDRELIIDKRLRERSLGIFEGRRVCDIMKEYPQYFSDPLLKNFRDSFTAKAPSGESYSDVCERVRPFLEELYEKKYKKVVIVAHFAAIRCLIKEIENLPEEEVLSLKIPNCSPITVHRPD